MSIVYVLDFADRIKIGITDDLKRRISQVQSASGSLVIKYFYVFGTKSLEAKAYNHFLEFRISGEFFKCSFEEAGRFLASQTGDKFEPFYTDAKSPRAGRPKSESPKSVEVKARIDEDTNEKLVAYCEKTGKTRTDVVREGIFLILRRKK